MRKGGRERRKRGKKEGKIKVRLERKGGKERRKRGKRKEKLM